MVERGVLLSEPYTKQFDGKLRELRFDLGGQAVRITYWIAPGRRVILLTVFAKTKDRDRAQVARAKKAMLACMQAEHYVERRSDGTHILGGFEGRVRATRRLRPHTPQPSSHSNWGSRSVVCASNGDGVSVTWPN